MNKDRLLKFALATAAFIAVAAVTLAPVKEVKAESASDDSAPAAPAKTEEEYREEARLRKEKLQEEREARYQAEIDNQIKEFTDQSVPENKTVSVAGSNIKTTIDGLYLAKSVDGVAITTPKEDLAARMGVAPNDIQVTTWDVNEKKSPGAYKMLGEMIEYYAENNYWGDDVQGIVTAGPAVQINVVAKTKSGVRALNADLISENNDFETVIGIPDDFYVEGAKYGYVCVNGNEAGHGGDLYNAGQYSSSMAFNAESNVQGKSIRIQGQCGDGVYRLFRVE